MYSLELGRTVGFPAGTRVAATCLRHGRPTAQRSPFLRRGRATRRSGWRMQRRQPAPRDLVHRARRFARMESAHQRAIAWVSGRTGVPQIYTMDQDGANIQRMTDSGYAVSPSWSPNGALLDLQLESQIRSRRSRRAGYLRLRHRQQALAAVDPRVRKQRLSVLGAGRAAYRFSERHRHRTQIWTMLADGTSSSS